MEELGETVQAFLEQEDEQVNLETSQLLYYLMVAVAVSRQGSIEKSIDQFRTLRAARIELPATLGLGFRELSESVGLAHGACMPGSFSADVNGRVADVFLKVDNLIEITGKGSWEGILAKL
ncbi:hypothetical protein HY024_02155 [Candidatus Curtissbacteria bacterium]|nr:hypothetical protein [Candidatus Curtissbacteria bacterium]